MRAQVPPLRVCLLVDSVRVPRWVASIAMAIAADRTTELIVVVRKVRSQPRFARSRLRPARILERLYLRLDHVMVRPLPDASELVTLPRDLGGGREIDTRVLGAAADRSANEYDQLRSLGLDVLLLFCHGLRPEDVAGAARHGVWYFADAISENAEQIGFSEVVTQAAVTVRDLMVRRGLLEGPLLLHRHYSPTDLRSVRRSGHNLLWKSASSVTRTLRELRQRGSVEAVVSLPQDQASAAAADHLSMPGLLTHFGRHAGRLIRDRVRDHACVEQWMLGYRFDDSTAIDPDLTHYAWLRPPRDRSWADPFPVEVDGRYFIFFEEIVHRHRRGYLRVAPIDEGGLRAAPTTVLEADCHLSYPFVFEWNGDWYLLPEAQASKRIDLYRFDVFPNKVSRCCTLLDNVRAADATLLHTGERWWMFVAIAPEGTWNVDQLFVFHAPGPLGPWTPHAQNPVKSDVRSARPAGRFLLGNGRYLRPAQDCSRGYGHSIRLQEIDILTDTCFREHDSATIVPEQVACIATHTINRAGALTVIDAKQRVSRWHRGDGLSVPISRPSSQKGVTAQGALS